MKKMSNNIPENYVYASFGEHGKGWCDISFLIYLRNGEAFRSHLTREHPFLKRNHELERNDKLEIKHAINNGTIILDGISKKEYLQQLELFHRTNS